MPRPKPRRELVFVRLNPDALKEVDIIATQHHHGNRSAALRQLLRLGLTAYQAGRR